MAGEEWKNREARICKAKEDTVSKVKMMMAQIRKQDAFFHLQKGLL